jgi:hypothetical protein
MSGCQSVMPPALRLATARYRPDRAILESRRRTGQEASPLRDRADQVDELPVVDLDLRPNEASGLLIVEDDPLREAHGWDRAFWVVLDEGMVEDSTAVVGHRRGGPIDQGWEIERLHASPQPVGDQGRTEDAEALARHAGWVYVFGSMFGAKAGPLQPKRSFVARLREAEVGHATADPAVSMQIARPGFAVHRLLNDALRATGPELAPLGPRSRQALIEATIANGEQQGKRWAGQVRPGDLPVNVEGAAFRDDGSLLLGLRFPVTAAGWPVLVDLDSAERLFEPGGGLPEVRGFWVVDAVGRDGTMAGVRDLTVVGDELHLVTGNLDAREKGSVLLEDYPEGATTMSTHWRCPLPSGARGGTLDAEPVREFPTLPRIEGLARDRDGSFFYVSDEDEGVVVRHTHLLPA